MNSSDREATSGERAEIAQLVLLFESQFHDGKAPSIEQFLQRLPAFRREVLRALLRAEIQMRQQAGDEPGIAEYLHRFPNDGQIVHEAFALCDRKNPDSRSTIWLEPKARVPIASSDDGTHTDTTTIDPSIQSTGPVSDGNSEFSVDESSTPELPESIAHFRVEGLLGKGGFGHVYRAYDTRLDRTVAIKGPSPARWKKKCEQRPDSESVDRIIEEFLAEARKAAGLKHTGLVAIYEFVVEDDRPYIVQELIDGDDLAKWAKGTCPSVPKIAQLTIEIAEALAYAHLKGFVHRDLKPANILIDRQGHPHITDFGLAMHESVRLEKRGELTGTLPYMSPEQVQGETQQVDGRSDLWSLGVILYELLVGRRPFIGKPSEIIQQIRISEPQPPRQRNPEVPEELDRICCQLLRKSTRERYSSAQGLIDDLRRWLDRESGGDLQEQDTPQPQTHILPKGLRSFDEGDASFFLRLLPGPYDDHGIPESIRFWKQRIGERDRDRTFGVGLICGPSGCGKSSIVRAGLLPRLESDAVPLYIDCSIGDPNELLRRAIGSHFPEIDEDLSLADSVQGLSRGECLGGHGKALLILDQFEQWIHGQNRHSDSQMLQALQACDGHFTQCLLLVRDDFWVPVNRLMETIGVVFVLGQNLAYVDLFDPPHARNVLFEFGRAYGCLPDARQELTPDQEKFLDHAVEGLIRDGKVICVRLAIFADMVKGMPWTTSTLRQFGGTEGLGVAFLDSTFNSASAPASYRHHRKAARAVLEALLPEAGIDIRGQMKSLDALQNISGYAQDRRRFGELVQILESDIRLITTTDPDDSDLESPHDDSASRRCYQLTHDYLVPTLRRWLELNESWFAKLRKWCRHPDRTPQAGFFTLLGASTFLTLHIIVLLKGLHVPFFERLNVPSLVGPMLAWIAIFDVPYIRAGIGLMRKRRWAAHFALAIDAACLSHSLYFVAFPDDYSTVFQITPRDDAVVTRYLIISLVVAAMTMAHLAALYSIRHNSPRSIRGH